MKLLDILQTAEEAVHEYFGYEPNWAVYPIEDCRDYYWHLTKNTVVFSESKDKLEAHLEIEYKESDSYYDNMSDEEVNELDKTYKEMEGEIYDAVLMLGYDNHKFEKEDYTMLMVDTQTDGNKFLSIYDNTKRIFLNRFS